MNEEYTKRIKCCFKGGLFGLIVMLILYTAAAVILTFRDLNDGTLNLLSLVVCGAGDFRSDNNCRVGARRQFFAAYLTETCHGDYLFDCGQRVRSQPCGKKKNEIAKTAVVVSKAAAVSIYDVIYTK